MQLVYIHMHAFLPVACSYFHTGTMIHDNIVHSCIKHHFNLVHSTLLHTPHADMILTGLFAVILLRQASLFSVLFHGTEPEFVQPE